MPGHLVATARVMQACEGHGAPFRPCAPDHDEHRLPFFDIQLLTYGAVRHGGTNNLFGLLKRRNRRQVGTRRDGLEVLFETSRCEACQYMAVFDLDWRSIFVMHELQVKDIGTLFHVQRPGDFTSGVLA